MDYLSYVYVATRCYQLLRYQHPTSPISTTVSLLLFLRQPAGLRALYFLRLIFFSLSSTWFSGLCILYYYCTTILQHLQLQKCYLPTHGQEEVVDQQQDIQIKTTMLLVRDQLVVRQTIPLVRRIVLQNLHIILVGTSNLPISSVPNTLWEHYHHLVRNDQQMLLLFPA